MSAARAFATQRDTFRALHESGLFVMPNPWDIGSARLLVSLGFEALATTSSGAAAAIGRPDHEVGRDEMLRHVESLAGAVDVPLSVDSERCFAEDVAGVAETIDLMARAGAAGCSIEDYDSKRDRIDTLDAAAERVTAAAAAARRHGMVLTARAENHLHGVDDLDDTITRLRAYRDAGAEVVYAPGLIDRGDIRRVVEAVGVPVNVLALGDGPSTGELAELGVRRVSTGGGLARAAYSALLAGARELRDEGTSRYLDGTATMSELQAVFRA